MDPQQTEQTQQTGEQDTAAQGLLAEDLIEEVSIDGMCGVY